MKGISQMLAAVLLVLMVVAISVIVSQWVNVLSRTQTETVRNSASQQLGCQFAGLFIKNVTYNCSLDCNAGTAHRLSVTVVNSGKKALNVTTLVVRNTTGSTYSLDAGGTFTVPVGEEVGLANVSTTTCDGINRTIDSVLVSSITCPSTAYDSFPGNLVVYASC